ncbi:hypothetical protein ACJIZ3_023753 [Penstemon smallii]|uniref:Nuclease associated modular domain-containing protein n=1 Tax=Penstemon smallii TaxID=265156 RepID=A0ABD3TPX8_9LAMI
MKLVNLGHAQTDETKIKIGVGVRLGWEKRRKKLKLQETCHYEWENLIAVAARKGLFGEEELQWGSYKILNKKLEKEWLESIEQRKNTPRPKGSKRAPKSAEQKRKISAAIAAKWADPGYRDRVCSALAKFHGTPEGVERKPRRKPSGDGQTRRSPKKKEEVDNLAKREAKSQTQRTRIKRSKTPLYKDPLASSKLEMLKSIRAQRAAAVNRKAEAITRAKLLIAEAEKAAEALEIAAQTSPIAQSSLIESKMLIAEAIQFMESIENEEKEEDSLAFENDDHPLEISTDQELHLENTQNLNVINHRNVNGVHKEEKQEDDDFGFNNFVLSDFVKGNDSISFYNGILETEEELQQTSFLSESNNTTNLNGIVEKPLVNGVMKEATKEEVKIIKKWVRGKLVEVDGES